MKTSLLFMAGSVAVAAIAVSPGCGSQGGADQDLIGTWQRLRDDSTLRDQYTFGQDGTFAFDEFKTDDPSAEDHMVGTYEATDGTVVAAVTNTPDGQRARLTFSYYASPRSFSTGAFLPTGAHDGIVGVWRGVMTLELLDETGRPPQGAEETDTYRDDGTFQATMTPSDGSPAIAWQGTYAEDSPGIFTANGITTDGAHRTATWQLLENATLVGPNRIWTRK
jgi:hypothetical protein